MNLGNAWDLLSRKLAGWGRQFVLLLPNLLLAVLVVVVTWMMRGWRGPWWRASSSGSRTASR